MSSRRFGSTRMTFIAASHARCGVHCLAQELADYTGVKVEGLCRAHYLFRCGLAFRSSSVLCSLAFYSPANFLRRGSANGREEDVSRNLTQRWVLPPEVAFAYYSENPFSPARRPPSTHSWSTQVWCSSQVCRDLTRRPDVVLADGIFWRLFLATGPV